MLQDQNVSRKLALAFGCVVVSVVAANSFIFMSNKAVDAAAAEAEETLELIRRGESVLEKALDAQGDLRGLYATANQDFAGEYREGIQALDEAFAELQEITTDEDNRGYLADIEAAIATFEADGGRFIELAASPDSLEQNRSRLATAARLSGLRETLGALLDHEREQQQLLSAESEKQIASSYLVLGIGGALAIAISIFMGLLLSRMIGRPVVQMTEAMGRLAKGDNAVDIPAIGQKDELGRMADAVATFKAAAIEKKRLEAEAAVAAQAQKLVVDELSQGLDALAKGNLTHRIIAEVSPEYKKIRDDFNAALLQLQDAMKMIVSNVQGIRTGAGEISQAADDFSRRTEQQAASLEETAAALRNHRHRSQDRRRRRPSQWRGC